MRDTQIQERDTWGACLRYCSSGCHFWLCEDGFICISYCSLQCASSEKLTVEWFVSYAIKARVPSVLGTIIMNSEFFSPFSKNDVHACRYLLYVNIV